jgi:hypothetical protein
MTVHCGGSCAEQDILGLAKLKILGDKLKKKKGRRGGRGKHVQVGVDQGDKKKKVLRTYLTKGLGCSGELCTGSFAVHVLAVTEATQS